MSKKNEEVRGDFGIFWEKERRTKENQGEQNKRRGIEEAQDPVRRCFIQPISNTLIRCEKFHLYSFQFLKLNLE